MLFVDEDMLRSIVIIVESGVIRDVYGIVSID